MTEQEYRDKIVLMVQETHALAKAEQAHYFGLRTDALLAAGRPYFETLKDCDTQDEDECYWAMLDVLESNCVPQGHVVETNGHYILFYPAVPLIIPMHDGKQAALASIADTGNSTFC